jgi:hypothetical protein
MDIEFFAKTCVLSKNSEDRVIDNQFTTRQPVVNEFVRMASFSEENSPIQFQDDRSGRVSRAQPAIADVCCLGCC